MMSNISKLIIYMTFLSSTMMAISSTNMLMIWMSMELNLFSFIPIILYNSMNNEMEASINYFFAQALGSALFLLSSVIMSSQYWSVTISSTILSTSILLKMGAAPCHYWYPLTMETSSWTNCLILSTWQKMVPLILLIYIILPNTQQLMMYFIPPMNALTGGIMGLSQTSMKKIMAYSSITHMGWMLSMPITNTNNLSIMYFIFYSTLTLPLFMLFNMTGTTKIYDLWNKQNTPSWMKMTSIIMLLSLGGLPPLTGFIPKLLIINKLMEHSSPFTMLLIMGSLMNLFFYLNISLNTMINNQNYPAKLTNMVSYSTVNMIITMNFLAIAAILL